MEWTPKELHTLRKLCYIYKAKDIARFLPGRSVCAIHKQLQRLNLRRRDIVKATLQEYKGRNVSELSRRAGCTWVTSKKYYTIYNSKKQQTTSSTMSYTFEHDLQVACVRWFRAQYAFLTPVFYSVPNGGFRNKATAGKMMAEGQQPGIADLCLDIPCAIWHGLRIEMKTDKGKQSEYQMAYENYCKVTGYRYVVCRSLEEFQQTVTCWVENAKKETVKALRSLYSSMQAAQASREAQAVIRKARKASSPTARVSRRTKESINSARMELAAVLGRVDKISSPALQSILSIN